MLRYVKFVQLPVRDQDRALRFYTATMGFTVATDAPYMDGKRWIEIAIPGADTRLVFDDRADDAVPATPTLVLFSDDVRGDAERLRSKGARFTQEPAETPWEKGKLYAMLLDSENNLVLLGDS